MSGIFDGSIFDAAIFDTGGAVVTGGGAHRGFGWFIPWAVDPAAERQAAAASAALEKKRKRLRTSMRSYIHSTIVHRVRIARDDEELLALGDD